MSLSENIKTDMKEAMLQKNAAKLSILRMLNAEIKNVAIDKRKEVLDDAEVLEVVSKLVKRHKESISNYQQAARQDLVDQEQNEMDILMAYMPAQMSEDEIREKVQKAVSDTGAASKEDLGKVMKAVMPEFKGKADGNLVNKIVLEELAK